MPEVSSWRLYQRTGYVLYAPIGNNVPMGILVGHIPTLNLEAIQ